MKNCSQQFDRPRRIGIRGLVALGMLLGMMSAYAAPVQSPRAVMTSTLGHAHVTASASLPGASAAGGAQLAWDRVGSPVNGIQTTV